ncbi:alpha/beta fold hydrolase [Acidobacteriota bacterium]
MKNFRLYGDPPYHVAVLHGGPGAPGQMEPVARELSSKGGVLEPLQTEYTLEGQVQELHSILEQNNVVPVTLIGSSWGGMLGFIFSAKYPALVRKLIMIGSGVYDKKSSENIQRTRLGRLNDKEKEEAQDLWNKLSNPDGKDHNIILGRLGNLFKKADAFNPFTLESDVIEPQFKIFQSVWSDVVKIRNSGELLKLGEKIKCPVVALHGDYDPHPAERIEKSLSTVLSDFKFIMLKNCGHLPWIEKEAKAQFYKVLKSEIS